MPGDTLIQPTPNPQLPSRRQTCMRPWVRRVKIVQSRSPTDGTSELGLGHRRAALHPSAGPLHRAVVWCARRDPCVIGAHRAFQMRCLESKHGSMSWPRHSGRVPCWRCGRRSPRPGLSACHVAPSCHGHARNDARGSYSKIVAACSIFLVSDCRGTVDTRRVRTSCWQPISTLASSKLARPLLWSARDMTDRVTTAGDGASTPTRRRRLRSSLRVRRLPWPLRRR